MSMRTLVSRTKASAPSGLARGHDQDVDPLEQRLRSPRGQARGDHQRGFAAGGFVAVLLRDDQHRRLAEFPQASTPASRSSAT